MKKQFLLLSEGEISLKGRNRKYFENILMENLNCYLQRYKLNVSREKKGRYIINMENFIGNIENIIDKIACVPGVKTIYLGYRINRDIDEAINVILGLLEGVKTFKIKAKRVDKSYNLTSMELNNRIGGLTLEKCPNLKVDVKNPERLICLEVFSDHFKIYFKKKNGLGGLPYGSSGRIICMLSAGIDSPVATFLMAKRGANIIPIYFHTPPYTGEKTLQKVRDIVSCLSSFTIKKIKLYVINYSQIQTSIGKNVPEKYWTVVSRRIMAKIAEEIASKEDAFAITTGESLGQVSSQTIYNIYAINKGVSKPIFRPLIGFDKEEIVRLSKEIGTYNISISEGLDCCLLFSPKNPITRANIKELYRFEDHLYNNDYIKYSYTTELI